jgi:26S proteasome regulatory subunit T2
MVKLSTAYDCLQLPCFPPPQGVILYGEPGTGKTLLAKAVANSTSATFLRVVGSELIQKYLGDGPKLVRELFRVADENAPSIVFIGETCGWYVYRV